MLAILHFVPRADGFVAGVPSGYDVIKDARQFVRRGGDGLGSTQFGAHPAIEVPEKGLAAMERERGHAERGGSFLDFASFDRQNLPPAYPVVRTESEPGGELRTAVEARKIRTDLRQKSSCSEKVDSGYLG